MYVCAYEAKHKCNTFVDSDRVDNGIPLADDCCLTLIDNTLPKDK